MKQKTLEEVAEWLNKKFDGKGVEIKIIDWGKNEKYNYPPSILLEEYAKYQSERMYSEEDIDKQIQDFKHDLLESTSDDVKELYSGAILGLNRLKQLKSK